MNIKKNKNNIKIKKKIKKIKITNRDKKKHFRSECALGLIQEHLLLFSQIAKPLFN